MNEVVLVGRLTKTPVKEMTVNGLNYTNFSVAVDRPFKNQNGEYETDFISCVAWGAQADFIGTYLKKGFLVGVKGSLQTRSYDKDGTRVFVTEVLVSRIQNYTPKEQNPAPQLNKDDLPF